MSKRCGICTAAHRASVMWAIGMVAIAAFAVATNHLVLAIGAFAFERCGGIVQGLIDWNDWVEIESHCTCEEPAEQSE